LADRLNVDVPAAAELAPPGAVVPHLTALHLNADYAGALNRNDEVDLAILQMVGDTLTGDDEVVGLQLLNQRLVNAALGAVGETWRFRGSDCHAGNTTPTPHNCRCAC
jgi:hypothetical protein